MNLGVAQLGASDSRSLKRVQSGCHLGIQSSEGSTFKLIHMAAGLRASVPCGLMDYGPQSATPRGPLNRAAQNMEFFFCQCKLSKIECPT